MNKKGFLLNELLICSTLSFILLIAIFNTTISLNQRLSNLYTENKAISKQIILNKKLAKSFANLKLSSASSTSSAVYTFYFCDRSASVCEDDKVLYIQVYKNDKKILIRQGDDVFDASNDEEIYLDDNMSFDNNPIKVSYENIDSNDKLVSFKIPIHYDGSDKDFGVELYNITNTKNSITVRN